MLGSQPDKRDDGKFIVAFNPGAGMRGARNAGMQIALQALGLKDCFDLVIGKSAGACGAAYLLTDQAPTGASIYYKDLIFGEFINPKRILRGRPVMNLAYLTDQVMAEGSRKLNWEQAAQNIPFKIDITAVTPERTFITQLAAGRTDQEIRQALHYTCRMPLVAGLPIQVGKDLYYTDGDVLSSGLPSLDILDKCTDMVVFSSKTAEEAGRSRIISRQMDVVLSAIFKHYHPSLADAYLNRHKLHNQVRRRLTSSNSPRIVTIRPESNLKTNLLERDPNKLFRMTIEGYEAVLKVFRPYQNKVHRDERVEVLHLQLRTLNLFSSLLTLYNFLYA